VKWQAFSKSRWELNSQRQTSAGVVDKPLDQTIAHRRAGSPDATWNFRRIAQQADRAFRDHFRRRTVTGIAIAADRDANLAPALGKADE